MLTNYYTLKALVSEWEGLLVHSTLLEGYSQHKGSLILVFGDESGALYSLNTSVQAPNRHMFLYRGSNRSRKNVVDVFPTLRGKEVKSISIANRDRLIQLQFTSGDSLFFVVYGPNANIFWQPEKGEEIHPFRGSKSVIPTTRPAPESPTAQEIKDVLSAGKQLKTVLRLFPPALIQEVWHVAGGTEDPQTLASAIATLEQKLLAPRGLIYWGPDKEPLVSVVELSHQAIPPEEFDSVNEAVRVGARKQLALSRFSGRYAPLVNAIQSRAASAKNSLQRVEEELKRPSRASEYEAAGHLIMAEPSAYVKGASYVDVHDWMAEGALRRFKMDSKLTAIENAQKYYEKAKSSKLAREKSLERIQGLKKTAEDLDALHAEVLALTTIEEVELFQKKHANWLQKLTNQSPDSNTIPYRQYQLEGGYEVWVGRNAKQNDQLTMKDARKFDLWLHARGVAGSHTVLRLNGKTDVPPKSVIEQAASIAAWHSKARPSALVPVIVVERKYVRKPRKALPGTVVVEREKVILVEPGVPTSD